MISNQPTLQQDYAPAVSYEELVTALELIEHATKPEPDDGGHHEAAHDLASNALNRVRRRREFLSTAQEQA